MLPSAADYFEKASIQPTGPYWQRRGGEQCSGPLVHPRCRDDGGDDLPGRGESAGDGQDGRSGDPVAEALASAVETPPAVIKRRIRAKSAPPGAYVLAASLNPSAAASANDGSSGTVHGLEERAARARYSRLDAARATPSGLAERRGCSARPCVQTSSSASRVGGSAVTVNSRVGLLAVAPAGSVCRPSADTPWVARIVVNPTAGALPCATCDAVCRGRCRGCGAPCCVSCARARRACVNSGAAVLPIC
jgi:hypothetical protein